MTYAQMPRLWSDQAAGGLFAEPVHEVRPSALLQALS